MLQNSSDAEASNSRLEGNTSHSPALSTSSTADGSENVSDGDNDSGDNLPKLPPPKLSSRAQRLLNASPPRPERDSRFEIASWGSPYPPTDQNVRRRSFSSELSGSDDSPLHQLAIIDTPFLRPAPDNDEDQVDETDFGPSAAAAAVLANRVRRQTRGLTEDWIRTHTAGDSSVEPRNWFSDGSGSEHSSLSGSEVGWIDEKDLQTPRPVSKVTGPNLTRSKHRPQARSSIETLRPTQTAVLGSSQSAEMATEQGEPMPGQDTTRTTTEAGMNHKKVPSRDLSLAIDTNKKTQSDGEAKAPMTPTKVTDKPLPKAPAATPRLKKKIPWNGKNILVLLPRDNERGEPGHPPKPLRQFEIDRMFSSWEELGYGVQGFDLLVEGYQPPGTDDSQSREGWPTAEDMTRERSDRKYHVVLPDLNAWQNYVNELQEAKLRALGVSLAPEEPEEPESDPQSRQASVQQAGLPFSPPVPTSSASSQQNLGYPFPQQVIQGRASANQSPGMPNGASPVPFGKFNPRQSISLPAGASPFQFPGISPQGWSNQQGFVPGLHRVDSPMQNINGLMSPHSPYGIEGLQPTGSPAFNMHQRQQSLQYQILAHQQQLQQQQQQQARASPRLEEVPEVEEEDHRLSNSVNTGGDKQSQALPTTADGADYHLEQQFRNQLEHKDYDPHTRVQGQDLPGTTHQDQSAQDGPEHHFVNEPGKPLTLHHPRPHSRGHSITKDLYQDSDLAEELGGNRVAPLKNIPEHKEADETYEIETNPSNLGTPTRNYDFASFAQHQKTMSTNSNPWNDTTSHKSHNSKPSFSKLNVQAPEFKFNPTSNFTPGLLQFSPAAADPAINHAESVPDEQAAQPPAGDFTVPQFGSDQFKTDAPAFGKGNFSFAASGPKFRPDAPAFTPLQPVAETFKKASRRTDSIFGDIQIPIAEDSKANRKSKAIPIIRPSSRPLAKSPQPIPETHEDHDHLAADMDADARVKRARSSGLEDETVPVFADRPEEASHAHEDVEQLELGRDASDRDIGAEAEESKESLSMEEGEILESVERDHTAEAGADEQDGTLPADTSMSSAVDSEQLDTMATTAAPSQASPTESAANNWVPFEFNSKVESSDFDQARPMGEGPFMGAAEHKTSLSATAPSFTPKAVMSDVDERADEEHHDSQHGVIGEDATKIGSESDRSSRALSPTPQPPNTGLGASRFAPKPKGLAASRFAASTSPTIQSPQQPEPAASQYVPSSPVAQQLAEQSEPLPTEQASDREPTIEEIDAIMQDIGNDPSQGVKKSIETKRRPEESLLDLQPLDHEPLQRPVTPAITGSLEDPFVDPPLGIPSDLQDGKYHVMPEDRDAPVSDWEETFSEDQHDKLEARAQFFDGRVNEVVGNLLTARLEPLEKALFTLQDSLVAHSARPTSSRRRDFRSGSAEFRESDADDEDDEPLPRRSLSPRKDRKMEMIRLAVSEALASQQREPAQQDAIASREATASHESSVLEALEALRAEFTGGQMASNTGNEEMRQLVAEVRQTQSLANDDASSRVAGLEARLAEMEEKLIGEQSKLEKEVAARREAQDESAELHRQLQAAETRVEVEIINRSVFDQRVTDLEEKLRNQEGRTDEEVNMRRAAEDKLSENQRLLRIATEEENRLREVVDERETKIKTLEQSNGKNAMRMALLEAAQNNATQSHSESTNRINALETDLKTIRQDNHHWQAEADRCSEDAARKAGELAHALDENKHMTKSLATLTAQLEENERLRETWRAKFISLQDDMNQAAREVAEESAQRIKKDQASFARQEVLDARLQAEAKTRERLEVELDRLQINERAGMRAQTECKRLEGLLSELKNNNHQLELEASRYKREFEEARESGASELKRLRMALQTEVDTANHQVNSVRVELEEQNSKLRAEVDNIKMEFDTAKAQSEMLLEDVHNSKKAELEAAHQKHQGEVEDLQDRLERQLGTAKEDGHKTEQHLLERLSLSSSKIEHLQDRIVHLEDKVEIAKEAAAAAAQAAKQAGVDAGAAATVSRDVPAAPRKDTLPEKISPQALRETIMVLQEQLGEREQRIEELRQTVDKLDPDSESKISKRNDEIIWLRELLAVRHSDLQDIIQALSSERYDRVMVKDAVIRLKANMQMEEQERERAMNGGSAINLPNIAQSLSQASPRVAQAASGAFAAVWGNLRKSSQGSVYRPGTATPSKRSPLPQNNRLGGLMTPPTSGLRNTPPRDDQPQPTAFASTGRRFPSHTRNTSDESRRRGSSGASRRPSNTSHGSRRLSNSLSARQIEKQPLTEEPFSPKPEAVQEEETEEDVFPRESASPEPSTPTMSASNAYDSDAQAADFDDGDFFEDDE